jgi:hypothetical protein
MCFIKANKNNVVRLLFVLKRVYRFPFTHLKAVKLETIFTLLLFFVTDVGMAGELNC